MINIDTETKQDKNILSNLCFTYYLIYLVNDGDLGWSLAVYLSWIKSSNIRFQKVLVDSTYTLPLIFKVN